MPMTLDVKLGADTFKAEGIDTAEAGAALAGMFQAWVNARGTSSEQEAALAAQFDHETTGMTTKLADATAAATTP